MTSFGDIFEVEYGIEVLSELAGEPLTKNGQRCRILDTSQNSSESFYLSDEQGKPYVHNFRDGIRLYPITAYGKVHNLTFTQACDELKKQYNSDGILSNTSSENRRWKPVPVAVIEPDYLAPHILDYVRKGYDQNGLVKYLRALFGRETTCWLIDRYWLGTSKHWRYGQNLSTILPQIDASGRIRQLKVIAYNSETGSRLKRNDRADVWISALDRYKHDDSGKDKIYFLGRDVIAKADPNLQQCFFGEHLLSLEPAKPVAIVEAESTAIVCSVYLPEFVWLATGGANGCRWYDSNVFGVLRNRNVFLFPDNGQLRSGILAYNDWSEKAELLSRQRIANSVTVNDLLFRNNLGLNDKRDLRDFLVKRDENAGFALNEGYPVFWDLPAYYYEAGKASVISLSTRPLNPNKADVAPTVIQQEDSLPKVIKQQSGHARRVEQMIAKNPALQQLIDSLDLALA